MTQNVIKHDLETGLEYDQQQGGAKQSYCKVDYIPITGHHDVFYSLYFITY